MPFRCKCGRTFEKPDTFSTHTSGCAPFHQRKPLLQTQQTPPSNKLPPLETSQIQRRISIRPTHTTSTPFMDQASSSSSSLPSSPMSSPTCSSSPSSMDYPVFMPTALSIQNAFEGVRRRSLSYGMSLK